VHANRRSIYAALGLLFVIHQPAVLVFRRRRETNAKKQLVTARVVITADYLRSPTTRRVWSYVRSRTPSQ